MITAVNLSLIKSEQGQSVIEFALMLPVLVALGVVLIRVNMAMQISIVGQQYARAQTLYLTFNSPYYPEISKQLKLVDRKTNQMILGVSDTVYAEVDGADEQPEATMQLVTRSKKVKGSSAVREEPATERSLVRVRNSVTLCTQLYWLGKAPLKDLGPAPNHHVLNYNLSDTTKFDYICGSPFAYE